MEWSGIKILVVEDSQTQRLMLEEVLGEKGAKVTSAENGIEGYKELERSIPSIIVTDIEMPVMNGYDFCRKVKQNPAMQDIPIILLTSLADPLDVIKGIQCGADNFLTKPCSNQLLISSIEDAIENKKFDRAVNHYPTVEFAYKGKKHLLKIDQFQITDLLLSTYASAIEKNKELEETNRKLSGLHLELQKKNIELTQLFNEKNLLLGMAAHDLRNPLSAISAYSQILEMKLSEHPDPKIMKMVKMINSSSQFMLRMVNDLLDVSAIDAGKLNLQLEKVNILTLARNNISLNEALAEQKQIALKFTAKEPIPEVVCDPNKVEQILNNLLSNAMKFSHRGGVIEINLLFEDNEVLLSVRDNGVGIPEEEKNKLFKSFGRTSAKSTGGEPGTGLGLAIVKRVVTAHEGRIWLDSELGKGTTFFVALPIKISAGKYQMESKEASKSK